MNKFYITTPIYYVNVFSDNFSGTVKIYDIREILIEKIRAVFQRGFPRDLYDVWHLLKNGVKVDNVLLDEKFKYKGIKIDIFQLEGEKEKIRNIWFTSLKDLISPVPDFNMVFDKVLEELQKYESKRY